MRIVLLSVFVFALTFGNAQIGGKIPSKEDVKNKLGKTKEKESKPTEKTDKVEEKTPTSTPVENNKPTNQNNSGGGNNSASSEKKVEQVVSIYPKVDAPTIFYAKDSEYKQPVTELTPGEGDYYLHVVFPTQNVNEYLVKNFGMESGEIYGHLKLSFYDANGNQVNLEGLVRDYDDRLVTFTFNESKKIQAVVIPILKAQEGTVQRLFAERINEKNSVAGMKTGINKINIEYSLDNSTASSQQKLANPKKIVTTSFNLNIKEENRAKAKKYSLEARDIETVEISAPAGKVHADNLGKIVFSKSPIPANSDDVSSLSTSFKLTDDIFGALCLSNCYKNILAEYGGSRQCTSNQDARIFIIVDGKEYINMPISASYFGCTRTFGNVTLSDKNNKSANINNNIDGAKALAYVISQIPAGKHSVKFEMRVVKSVWETLGEGRPPLMASGEMSLEFTTAERDEYVKKNGQSFEFTSDITSDATITALAKKEIPGAINYKVSEMIIQRNIYDKITHREGYMNAIVKNEDGDYELRTYKTTQQYVGGKWESKMTVQYLNSYWYFVPVQNHKS